MFLSLRVEGVGLLEMFFSTRVENVGLVELNCWPKMGLVGPQRVPLAQDLNERENKAIISYKVIIMLQENNGILIML
jgi:hypothetical protein